MADPARGRLHRWAVILCALWVGGCATYTDTLSKSRTAADRGEKIEPTFAVDVVDEQQQIVTRVEKLLYVRKKNAETR